MKPAVLVLVVLAAAVLALALPGGAHAGAIEPFAGCSTHDLGPADDSSSAAVVLPFTVNYFGVSYNSLYVNNNGNVTFDSPMLDYTPSGIPNLHRPLIAPFFADVDSRGFASNTTHYGATTVGGNDAFCVLWDGVGYYNSHSVPLNRFQLLLIDRPDRGAGAFDIVFNYDQIQWETGDASGGTNGLGGVSAEIGYSNLDQHFELPGSRVPGSFLDANPTGLIHGDADAPDVPGRYIFHVDNGTPPIGANVSGSVWDTAAGSPVPVAFVDLCPNPPTGSCRTTSTREDGSFTFLGVGDGTYTVYASPPSLSTLNPGSTAVTVAGSDVTGKDVVLQTASAMPTGTTLTTPSRGTTADGIPSVFWNDPITLTTLGCTGGTGTATLTAADGFTEFTTLVEGAPGQYSGTLAALFPHHGHASIATSLTCGTSAAFDLYVLPSGNVKTTLGEPLAAATVTLLAADTPAGPFAPVPSGSPLLSPGNRLNPSASEGGGAFGWDVLSGYYKVRAELTGCHAPGDPAQPFVESGVLSAKPIVAGTVLTLDCTAPVDNTAPTITASGLMAEATGPLTVVDYTFDATDPDDPVASASCAPAPGSSFPVGSTPIHCAATDSHGNTGTADFSAAVSDTTPPVLTVPATIHADATSPNGAVVTYTASATDLVDGAITPSCAPSSGSTFQIGTTTVHCSAIDSHGNPAAAQFDVVVNAPADNTAPTITASGLTAEAAGPQTVVNYTFDATDPDDAVVTSACSPAPGSSFPVGSTPIHCTATDSHGNAGTAEFTVVVTDTTPPTLTVPATIHAEATSAAGASVVYTVSANDLVDDVVVPSCTPASGHNFALGTTTVDCTATDNHGNSSTKQFDVVVGDTTPPALTVPATIHVVAGSPAGAVVMYSATAVDLVDATIAPSCSPASGSTVPVGTTTVTCIASDVHGNSVTKGFDVVVAAANMPPTANAGGPYTVAEGGAVTVTASGTDPEHAALSYAWDLDNNGSFETPGQSVSFSATFLDGPSTATVEVQVTDDGGLHAAASANVDVTNIAPSASFNAPPSVVAGASFVLSLIGATDPSAADTAAAFTYAFDCGNGFGAFDPTDSVTCATATVEALNVGAKIRDKDGGTRTYAEAIDVGVTYDSLKTLTTTLVTKKGVAESLCDKLDTAAAAYAHGDTATRDGALNAYRNQLDAQTGKSVTAADAAELKSVSHLLQ